MSQQRPALAETLSRFADRLFMTGGHDPGDGALAVPPQRMAVYHELVQRNYLSMLRFAHTATFRIVAHEAKRADREDALPASVTEVVLAYLAENPPAGHSTRLIADTFRPFFERRWPGLFARWPALESLMDVERAHLRANYHWDDPGRGPDEGELERLANADAGAFLALSVVRAPSSTTLRSDQPGATLYHRVMHRRFPDPSELTDPEAVLVSRHPDRLEPVVRVVDDTTVLAHELAPSGEPIVVEALAERWVSALPTELAGHEDEALLAAFAKAVFVGLADGALRLA